MMSVHPRITIEPDKRDGKPCIRGMRITVNDVLGWLAHGMTEEEILEEHPGVRILLDQNLSPRLIRRLADILPGLESVYDHGLTGSSDPFIFE